MSYRSFCFTLLVLMSSLMFSVNKAYAVEGNVYGVISLGYAQSEVDKFESDKASYKIAFGYELTPQWYLEGGFTAFGENNAGGMVSERKPESFEIAGLNLSVLGKARNGYGDLFYRIGVSRVSADVLTLATDNCSGDVRSVVTSAPTGDLVNQFCSDQNAVLAGNVGLGFDLFVQHSSMIRFELEYTKGEQNFSALGAYVGLRVNF